jgi:hypothetical protein
MPLGRYKELDNTKRGIIMMLGGTILLLHALGFLKIGLDVVIIIVALYMILYGFIQSQSYHKLQQILEKTSRK